MGPKIIKANPQRIVKREEFEAGQEAHQIIVEAQAQAAAILAEAEAARKVLIESGHDQGYQEGLTCWNQSVEAAIAERDAYLARCESEVLKMAVRIAEKILGEELRTHPDKIVGIVREALTSVRRERSLSLRVNPEDADRVRTHATALAASLGPNREIQVIADPAVGRGGCLVESELGTIDARLETQLRCMQEILGVR
jgi:type III secretion protein L